MKTSHTNKRYFYIYTHLFKCIRHIQVHKDTTKVDSKKFLVWFVFFLFFFVFFFCKQQIAFQWHDCCSSLLLVRCVCSDKTNVHMLYTISNTYFAFLPSNVAFIEDQRREICWKIRILAMATTKLALFHIFWYRFWTDSTDNNHLHLHVCIYVSYRLYNF